MKNEIESDVVAIETQPEVAPGGAEKNAVLLFVDDNMPELKDASDEEKYAAAADFLSKGKIFNEKMAALFESEPMIGQLISAIMKGDKSVPVALAEMMSPDEFSKMVEEGGGDVIKAREGRLSKLKEIEDAQALTESNFAQTGENISKWLEEKAWDAEKQEDFFSKATALFEIMKDGVLTDKELDAIERMIYFDDFVNSAREEAMLAGRNEKINSKRLEEEAKKITDDLPPISGGGAVVEEISNKRGGYFDDVIAKESDRQAKLRGA